MTDLPAPGGARERDREPHGAGARGRPRATEASPTETSGSGDHARGGRLSHARAAASHTERSVVTVKHDGSVAGERSGAEPDHRVARAGDVVAGRQVQVLVVRVLVGAEDRVRDDELRAGAARARPT